MTAINRNTTPPGPITELYDRLDELHLKAGMPSMREIATRAGRGRISSSTVHNVFAFRNARVPRWPFLEEIVKALAGDTAVFLALWQAAWQAENNIVTPRVGAPETVTANPAGARRPRHAPPGSYPEIWSAEVPARDLNFTGRVTELETLRANLIFRGRPVPPAQVISGMGGVGKTEIAAEYIHAHRDKYEHRLVDPGRTSRPDPGRAGQIGRAA